jgi:hypothetical protein
MSVQVSVSDETYIDVSNGGWDRFLTALINACGIDAFPDLLTRDVYCDISADRCAEFAAKADALRETFASSTSDPFIVGIYDEMVIAFHAGAETGTGVSIS